MPHTKENKNTLHPRNKHQGLYDFKALVAVHPKLKAFIIKNPAGLDSIDFSDAKAVRALNKALLLSYYDLKVWDIPTEYLCPPVPGRADYVHYLADFLASKNGDFFPEGEQVTCLDVGVGANCIYPIIGIHEYGWNFIGSEIDTVAINNTDRIRILNPSIKPKLEIRHQAEKRDIFHGIITAGEKIDFTMCNPPFHASQKAATRGSKRKVRNLGLENKGDKLLNFEGKANELVTEGGEVRFIRNMIHQSKRYAGDVLWFSSIVSKKDHLKDIYKTLRQVGTFEFKIVNMAQGNKVSRFVIWTFQNDEQQQEWMDNRWE